MVFLCSPTTAGSFSETNGIITRIFSGFALITIFMAATGMFALVSLTVLKRLREIAIRKVVGARGRRTPVCTEIERFCLLSPFNSWIHN